MSNTFTSSSIAAAAILFACCACGACGDRSPATNETHILPSVSDESKAAQIVDLVRLIRQEPKVFDKTFGKAVESFETDDPRTMPGEMRDYKIPGVSNPQTTTAGMTVRFFKDKAVEIMVDLPAPVTSSAIALKQFGLDTRGEAPEISKLADYWSNMTFNGVKFKGVWVYKLDAHSPLFTTIKVASE